MRKLILAVATILTTVSVNAQQVKMCGTDEHMRELLTNPAYTQQKAEFEAKLQDFMKSYSTESAKANQQKLGKSSAPKYIIPVVVHIFHNNGSENISDAQVQSEIDFLNKSFRKLNSDTSKVRSYFRDIAADAQIEFRLARKDPNGNCTNGIVRVATPLTNRGNDNLKKLSVWDTKRYFNMWVVRTINRGPGVSVAGYAQFPFFAGGASSSSTDGIMVIHNEFGNIGTSLPGQTPNVTTSTHEAGHWFGLYHPFQGDSCDNEGDGIQETPTTYKWQEGLRPCCPAVNCSKSPCTDIANLVSTRVPNTCSSDNPDLPDMIENFMDYYIGDSASNMFSLQQVARMHFCLENYRRELWQPSNLAFTGTDVPNTTPSCKPIPAFSSTTGNSSVCAGVDITFRDNSYNGNVTAREWNFGDGATPATSTSATPTVNWSTGGWKTITLTATNANGSTTTVFPNAIYVQDNSSYAVTDGRVAYADWDYINDFLNKGWSFENETPGARWIRTTNASKSGGISLMLDRTSLTYGSTYSLISPTFNLAGASNPFLSFDYAFATNYIATNTNDSRDALTISVSNDCGKTWIARRTIQGDPNQATTPNPLNTNLSPLQPSVSFVPSNATQWKTIDLTGANVGTGAALNSVKFKITFTYSGGNNLYFDNMAVGTMNTSTEEQLKPSDIRFEVYPNPFNQTADIHFETVNTSNVSITLMDIAGKQISQLLNEAQLESGQHKVTIDKSSLNLKSGMYFINVKVGNSSFTHKVILQ